MTQSHISLESIYESSMLVVQQPISPQKQLDAQINLTRTAIHALTMRLEGLIESVETVNSYHHGNSGKHKDIDKLKKRVRRFLENIQTDYQKFESGFVEELDELKEQQ